MKYRIWYKKYWEPSEAPTDFQEWIMVKELEASGIEQAFALMQKETENPTVDTLALFHKLGTSHISIMVGDFIETPRNEFYRIEGWGFEKYNRLPPKEKIELT